MAENKEIMTDVQEVQAQEGHEENKMGTAPVGKLLASMAWPAILSMLISALYNVVDSIFVAMISQKALTAVSLVMPVQMLITALAVGSGVGVNSLIARRLGAKRFEEADKAASTSVRIAVFNYIIFLIVGLFLTVPFMNAYTSDSEIFEGGVTYMRIVTCASLFFMVEISLEKVLQSTGNMLAPMLTSLTGAVTNIILDPILIFGLFGAPKMGIAGAAVATVSGQALAMTVALFVVLTREHAVKVRLIRFKMDWHVVKDIYAVGFPSIIMQAIGSVMLLGYNAILAASATLLFQLFPQVFLLMFNADSEMLEMGVPALRLISICFLPAAFGIMTSTLFQGTGHGIYSLFASLIRQLIGILPLAYILYNLAGVTASWMSFPLAEIIGLVYSALMFRHLYNKEIRNL